MNTVCDINKCAGCSACIDVCPLDAIHIVDNMKSLNAVVDLNKCINCNACKNVCQEINKSEKRKSLFIKQGWAIDENIRKNGASGGIASAVARHFLNSGGIVCASVFNFSGFVFDIIENEKDLIKIAGSRYIKSNPIYCYKKCKNLVIKGRRVLFIGLPCQVASFKNYIPIQYHNLITTIDLICHGTPSEKLLNIFLNQYKLDYTDFSDIKFRSKGVQNKYSSIKKYNVMDSYTIGFLNSLFYTDNCYECKYADINRVSDITLGDSWGSELNKIEIDKGISLVLCQSEKGKFLLDNSNIILKDVNVELAIKNNHQLKEPSLVSPRREWFFNNLEKGKPFNLLIMRVYPIKFIKQFIKQMLISLKLYSLGNGNIYCILKKRIEDE